ncbi:MAG: DUF3037 domain-containing protein [Pirellulaceae bacterium]|nr:DUF3037 domain-containing protein [Pirellulaceae bacterium]
MLKAFYSVIQFCPDRFRAEAVNVGLLLICLEPHAVRVGFTRKLNRARSLFEISKKDMESLKLTTEAMRCRIEGAAGEWRTQEELAAFAASRANDLRLTEPRLAKIEDIDTDFERLFNDLVEQRSSAALADASPAEVLPPSLSEVFYRLQKERKIWKPGMFTVPVFNRKLDIPYAFKNGVVNLIKPEVFAGTRRAETQAANLAVNGDLIQRNPINGESHKLIVLSTHETLEQAKEIDEHVGPLFKEYNVRLVRPHEAQAFAEEVERSAH